MILYYVGKNDPGGRCFPRNRARVRAGDSVRYNTFLVFYSVWGERFSDKPGMNGEYSGRRRTRFKKNPPCNGTPFLPLTFNIVTIALCLGSIYCRRQNHGF